MLRILGWLGTIGTFRSAVGGWPGWAKLLLLIFALPGLALVGLSILAFAVSILALLICTAPVLWLMRVLYPAARPEMPAEMPGVVIEATPPPSPGRKPIDVRIIDET